MYLTAQRVVSPSNQRGVNVFEYRHHRSWDAEVPADCLPSANPGILARQFLELAPPFGNRVLSYLDFVTPDDTSPPDALRRLHAVRALFRPMDSFATAAFDRSWCQLRIAPGLRIPANVEAAALAGHILLKLFNHR